MFSDQRFIIMGIANEFSIAYAVAKALTEQGARLAFTYLPDTGSRPKNRERLERLVRDWDPVFVQPCDVTVAEHWAELEKTLAAQGPWHGGLHAVAGAPYEEVLKPLWQSSAKGLNHAMEVSVASLIALTRALRGNLAPSSSLVTLSYIGASRVIPGYQMMGVCKAALEACVKYLAFEMATDGVRINAVSAPPIKTLSASALPGFELGEWWHQLMTPDGQKIGVEPVVQAVLWLLGKQSSAVTGAVLPTLGGFEIMGAPNPLLTESMQLGKITKLSP